MRFGKLGLAVVISATSLAADLKLGDGRVLSNYRVVSQTATTVLVRYAGGVAKVEKKLLPSDVLSQYPIDEKGAAAEAAEIAKGKTIYEANVRAATEAQKKEADAWAAQRKRELEKETQREAEAADARARYLRDHPEVVATPVKSESEQVSDAAKRRAERYFNVERIAPSTSLTLELHVDIDPPRAVSGWSNRWEVVGVGWWQAMASQGGFAGDKSWFRAYVERDRNGILRVTDFTPNIAEPIH